MNNTKYDAYLPRQVRQQSRWAEEEEIKNSPCVQAININEEYTASGLPILSDGERLWVDTSDNHTIIYGTSGSKKTRTVIMPTILSLLQAGESVIVTDPKGELFERCAGYAKKQGYHQVVLDFRTRQAHRWNPLLEAYLLYKGKQTRDEGISMLSNFLTALSSSNVVDDRFWNTTGMALLLGCALILFEAARAPQEVTMENLIRICQTFGSDDEKYLRYIIKKIPDSICKINLESVLGAADNTRRSIQASVFSFLQEYLQNTQLLDMLSGSDFSVKDLTSKKMAVWLVLPDEHDTYGTLISQFLQQTYQQLIFVAQRLPGKRLYRRVNFVLDEFCNIGTIPDFDKAMAAARSRNIRYFLVVQTNLKKYGDSAEIIQGNATNLVFLNSRSMPLLNQITELCGVGADGQPLISTSQLQRLRKETEYSEALILHDRLYPFVTKLPDISGYRFEKCAVPRITREQRIKAKYTIQEIVENNQDKFEKWFQ